MATAPTLLSEAQMTVTEKFKDDSARAAISALRGLEQTAIMLERWAPDVFPEVNEQGQKHFGRVMMESAAQAIREAWAQAVKGAENSDHVNHVLEVEQLRSDIDFLTSHVYRLQHESGLRLEDGDRERYEAICTRQNEPV